MYWCAGALAVIILAAILIPLIYKSVLRSNARQAEEREADAFSELRKAAIEVTKGHLDALLRQRRQKLYKDAYGQIVTDDWIRELEYFVESVLIPRINRLNLSTITNWLIARNETIIARGQAEGGEGYISVSFDPSGEAARGPLFEIIFEFVELEATQHPEPDYATNTPGEFELSCEKLLAEAGWSARRVGATGDQGADVVAERDGLRGVFQCKLYSDPVGNAAVQQAFAAKAFYGAHFAAVICDSGYTRSARQAAEATGVYLLSPDELEEFEPEEG